jgi:hypothetical protein
MDHWVDTIAPEKKRKTKKKQINTYSWSFFWQKMQISTFLHIGALNFYSRVLRYAEYDGVIFIKIIWLLWGVSSFFGNKANFLRLVFFDG